MMLAVRMRGEELRGRQVRDIGRLRAAAWCDQDQLRHLAARHRLDLGAEQLVMLRRLHALRRQGLDREGQQAAAAHPAPLLALQLQQPGLQQPLRRPDVARVDMTSGLTV